MIVDKEGALSYILHGYKSQIDKNNGAYVYCLYSKIGRNIKKIKRYSKKISDQYILENSRAVKKRLTSRPLNFNDIDVLERVVRNEADAIAYTTWLIILECVEYSKKDMRDFTHAYEHLIKNIEYFEDRSNLGYVMFLFKDMKLKQSIAANIIFTRYLSSQNLDGRERLRSILKQHQIDTSILLPLYPELSSSTAEIETPFFQNSLV